MAKTQGTAGKKPTEKQVACTLRVAAAMIDPDPTYNCQDLLAAAEAIAVLIAANCSIASIVESTKKSVKRKTT